MRQEAAVDMIVMAHLVQERVMEDEVGVIREGNGGNNMEGNEDDEIVLNAEEQARGPSTE